MPQNRNTDRTTQYARKVVSGKIIANEHVKASCQRHINDLERKDISFDKGAANRAFYFIEKFLKLNGGQFEGKPFILHESQAFIVGSIFGWKRKDGKRKIRRVYIEIGKGNGKSPLAAAIGLYGLIGDNESRAEIYAAASKLDQAKILFRDAKAMVEQSTDLGEILTVTGGEQSPNIAYIKTASFFRPMASDKAQSGPRPHMALCDEIHEHTSRNTLEMLERGFKWREQPLLFMITNSGFDKTTVCFEEHDHAIKVAHGIIKDDTTFSFVCGIDEGDDPLEDESCWQKASPLLGVTISKQYLRDIVDQAKNTPGKKNGILRLHFCVWTDAEAVWLNHKDWVKCEKEKVETNKEMPCFLALDLSAKRDLTSMAAVWQESVDRLKAKVWFWTPEDTLKEREKRDKVEYRTWRDEGYLFTTPSGTVDYKHVVPFLGKILGENDVRVLGYDRWRIDLLKNEMDAQGIDMAKMQPFGQGFKDMGPAVDAIESAILNGYLEVEFNPVLRWNVASTVIVSDPAGSRKFAKNKSTGRIDGVVALTMAVALAERDESVNIDEFISNPIIGKY